MYLQQRGKADRVLFRGRIGKIKNVGLLLYEVTVKGN